MAICCSPFVVVSCYLVLVVCSIVPYCSANADFNYDDQCGWEDLAGSQCSGRRQSPITIVTPNIQPGNQIGLIDLDFGYLDTKISGTLKNNGHTLKFTPSTEGLTLRTHRGTYELLQFHFHWGDSDAEGSEHRLDGQQFSGEMHFVHKTTKRDAVGTEFDYYTVVGVLLLSDGSISSSGTIWESFMNVPGYNEEVAITNVDFTFRDLLPSSNPSYNYYSGSLTTPLCNEIVQWVVLKEYVNVPTDFFVALRGAEDAHGHHLKYNFRHAQPLHGRVVYEH